MICGPTDSNNCPVIHGMARKPNEAPAYIQLVTRPSGGRWSGARLRQPGIRGANPTPIRMTAIQRTASDAGMAKANRQPAARANKPP